MDKKTFVKKVIRCRGMTSAHRPIQAPMKAVLFARKDTALNVAVLYTGSGRKIGTFTIDELDALRVAARVARIKLSSLATQPNGKRGEHERGK